MLLFALLFLVCAFDAGQSKPAFPNGNDSDKIDVDQSHGSDYPDTDEPGSLGYNTVDEPAEADDGLSEVELARDQSRRKKWVPTEVSVDQVMQKVLHSRLVNNRERQGKRQSAGYRASTDDDGVTPNEEPFPPVSLHRHFTEGRLFTEELSPVPNGFVYKSEANEGNSESLSDVEHPGHIQETTSMMGKKPFAQKRKGEFSKWKILQRPSHEEKHLRDILILSDYLDRQRARKSSRQPQLHRRKNRQERQGQEDYYQRLIHHPSLYVLTVNGD